MVVSIAVGSCFNGTLTKFLLLCSCFCVVLTTKKDTLLFKWVGFNFFFQFEDVIGNNFSVDVKFCFTVVSIAIGSFLMAL